MREGFGPLRGRRGALEESFSGAAGPLRRNCAILGVAPPFPPRPPPMLLPALPLLVALSPLPAPQSVAGAQKISSRYGGFPTPLLERDQFGRSVTRLGDLDLDGVVDLAVGAHGDDDGGSERGAVHILFLTPTGEVKGAQKISSLAGGFVGPLDDGDQIARGVAGLGDLDGDGIPDLAVGSNNDDDGGPNRGAVWILFLNRDGTVKSQAKIAHLTGGFGPLRNRDEFGRAAATPGDFDGDGVPDLFVGAPYDDAGGVNMGAVYLLLLTPAGNVKTSVKIASGLGGFRGPLRANDLFGFGLGAPGDLDGDGIPDLLVGAVGDDDGGTNVGAAWVLFLNANGSVKAQQKIGRLTGGFAGILDAGDQFGTSLAGIGDLDGDGRPEIAVSALRDDDGGNDRGAVWILHLTALGTVAKHEKISSLAGGFPLRLRNSDWFGSSLGTLGDLNGDGAPDLVVGARMDDDLGMNRGAVYVTLLASTAALRVGDSGPRARPTGPDAPRATLAVSGGCVAPGATLELVATGLPETALEPRLLVARAPLARSPQRLPGLEVDARRLIHVPGRLTREPGLDGDLARLALRLPDDPSLHDTLLQLQLAWIDSETHLPVFGQRLALRVD